VVDNIAIASTVVVEAPLAITFVIITVVGTLYAIDIAYFIAFTIIVLFNLIYFTVDQTNSSINLILHYFASSFA
jgi:hypothetical protein